MHAFGSSKLNSVKPFLQCQHPSVAVCIDRRFGPKVDLIKSSAGAKKRNNSRKIDIQTWFLGNECVNLYISSIFFMIFT